MIDMQARNFIEKYHSSNMIVPRAIAVLISTRVLNSFCTFKLVLPCMQAGRHYSVDDPFFFSLTWSSHACHDLITYTILYVQLYLINIYPNFTEPGSSLSSLKQR